MCPMMYASIEYGFSGGVQDTVKKSTLVQNFSSFLQQLTFVGLPFTMTLPASMQVRAAGGFGGGSPSPAPG